VERWRFSSASLKLENNEVVESFYKHASFFLILYQTPVFVGKDLMLYSREVRRRCDTWKSFLLSRDIPRWNWLFCKRPGDPLTS